MYIVVLEGTGGPNSNNKGVRTIIDFGTKAEFELELRKPDFGDKVVDQGVSEEEAQVACDKAPIQAWFHAAIDEAFVSSELQPFMLQMKMNNMVFLYEARRARGVHSDVAEIDWDRSSSPIKTALHRAVDVAFASGRLNHRALEAGINEALGRYLGS